MVIYFMLIVVMSTQIIIAEGDASQNFSRNGGKKF